MTESEPLLEVEPVEPTWLKLKRKHSITATYLEHQDKVGAIYGTHYALGDDERYDTAILQPGKTNQAHQ